jgi:hypothetical protein
MVAATMPPLLQLIVGWLLVAPLAAGAAALVMRREGALRAAQWLRALMVFGLAAGTTTHVLALVRFGLVPSPSQPLAFNCFWTALALVDPAIALALVFWPRAGIAAAIVLMIADVAINVIASGGFGDWPVWFQSAYGLFVVIAAPCCWKRSSLPAQPSH